MGSACGRAASVQVLSATPASPVAAHTPSAKIAPAQAGKYQSTAVDSPRNGKPGGAGTVLRAS